MKRILFFVQKPLNGYIVDRRLTKTCIASVMLITWIIVWVQLSAAIADTLPTNASPVTQGQLTQFQWWALAGLLGFVVAILGAFGIYILSGVKESMRDGFTNVKEAMTEIKGDVKSLFALHGKLSDEVVTIDDHKAIDHSMLCPKCRREG
jgi:hypothetical protein